ncbi:hypothetical protein SRIMM317S_06830 [Streptomyces rimosus subsp. rimosus]
MGQVLDQLFRRQQYQRLGVLGAVQQLPGGQQAALHQVDGGARPAQGLGRVGQGYGRAERARPPGRSALEQLPAPGGVRFRHHHAGPLALHVQQDVRTDGGGDGFAGRAQQYGNRDLSGQCPADAGGAVGERGRRVRAGTGGEQLVHEAPLVPQPLARLAGRRLGEAAYGFGHQPVQVLEAGFGQFVHGGGRDRHLLADLGQAPPGQPYAQPVDRLEGVQAAPLDARAAAELLEDPRVDVRQVQAGGHVLDEVLQGLPDSGQGARLAVLVQGERELRILAADLGQNALGERRDLVEGAGGELPYLRRGYVAPRRADGLHHACALLYGVRPKVTRVRLLRRGVEGGDDAEGGAHGEGGGGQRGQYGGEQSVHGAAGPFVAGTSRVARRTGPRSADGRGACRVCGGIDGMSSSRLRFPPVHPDHRHAARALPPPP